MTFTDEEARAILIAAGRDDTPQAIADVISDSLDPTTPASLEGGSSEVDTPPAGAGDAGTSPSPSEEPPTAPEAPVEPQGPPETPTAPQATPEEVQAAAAVMQAAGYQVSPAA